MPQHSTAIGTIGGTLMAIITVNATTIVATVIVAAIGAITSFFVSLFLKWMTSKVIKWLKS